jgi:hypothetical protein
MKYRISDDAALRFVRDWLGVGNPDLRLLQSLDIKPQSTEPLGNAVGRELPLAEQIRLILADVIRRPSWSEERLKYRATSSTARRYTLTTINTEQCAHVNVCRLRLRSSRHIGDCRGRNTRGLPRLR